MRSTRLDSSAPHLAAVCAILALFATTAAALTPIDNLRYSADTTTIIDGVTYDNGAIVEDDLAGSSTRVALGAVPQEADVDAHHQFPISGDNVFSVGDPLDLGGGIVARPEDVVRSTNGIFTIEFDASAHGIPSDANTDAVSFVSSDILLSFDTTLDFGGFTANREDLVRFDGVSFSLFFDGSIAGVPAGANLDAAQYLDSSGNLLLSFDIGGTIGSVTFRDEDVLEYDTALQTWEMAYDASAQDSGWNTSDLDAVATATAVCGDSTVSSSEACDDGNSVGGDCCDATCTTAEPDAAPCAGDGNICTGPDVCMNGICAGDCRSGQACSICGGTCAGTTPQNCECQ